MAFRKPVLSPDTVASCTVLASALVLSDLDVTTLAAGRLCDVFNGDGMLALSPAPSSAKGDGRAGSTSGSALFELAAAIWRSRTALLQTYSKSLTRFISFCADPTPCDSVANSLTMRRRRVKFREILSNSGEFSLTA